RLPILARCPAAVRFVSYEPAIGPVNFAEAMGGEADCLAFDWIICGGESGPHARPMEPQWARDVQDLCAKLGTPFFMKQMGGTRSHNDAPIPPDLLTKQFPEAIS
ncbi:MAG: DUF5131 family protein, partial [Candidatus Acidiferrales bacterium]